ncbi:MAG: TIR domain-containing protein [Lachnospiraceae bacterium]|nr:TIR domain-containing protein [Lachnospiraceae bacterium]
MSTENNNVTKYDAFISYRHCEQDKFVAITLHKKLESYRPPKGVISVTGKKRIERVFRDEDELPLSSNLSDPINLALENSEFLIVICTPRLPESEWCKREIETFIKLHGRDKILAVLAEGEPEESFPEALTKEEYEVVLPDGTREIKTKTYEPLAADVRGKSKREIKKGIDDAVLRITAAIFGLNYDAIKQRHKERKLKRTISIVSGVAGAFMLFSAVCIGLLAKIITQSEMIMAQNEEIKAQSREISDKNEQIKLQFEKAQYDLSIATAKNSKDLMEEGKKYEAIQSLRQVMPSSSSDTSYPYTPEAEKALCDCLEVYADDTLCFEDFTFSSESNIKSTKMTRDGSKVMTIDACNNIHVFDTETGKELFSALGTNQVTRSERMAVFISSDQIICNKDSGIVIYNFNTNEETVIPSPDGSENYNGELFTFIDAGKFIVFSDKNVNIYSIETGVLLQSFNAKNLVSEDTFAVNISKVAATSNGKYMAFTSNSFYDSIVFSVFDIETGEIVYKETIEAEISSALISDGNNFFASSSRYLTDFSNSSEIIFSFNCDTMSKNWEIYDSTDISSLIVSDDSSILYGSSVDYLCSFDTATGELISKLSSKSAICDVFVLLDSDVAAVMTTDCRQFNYHPGEDSFRTIDTFNTRPTTEASAFAIAGGNIVIQFKNASYVTLYRLKTNEDKKLLFEDSYFSLQDINEAGNLYIKTYNDGEKYHTGLFNFDSSEPIATLDDYTHFSFVGKGDEYVAGFGKGIGIFDVKTGKKVKEITGENSNYFSSNSISFDREYLSESADENKITVYSLTTGEACSVIETDSDLSRNCDVYLIDKETCAVKDEKGTLKIYKTGGTTPVFTLNRIMSENDSFILCESRKIFCICFSDGTADFYSFEDEIEQIKTLSFPGGSNSYGFRYYPEKDFYLLDFVNLSGLSLILNKDLEIIALLPLSVNYRNEMDDFVFNQYEGNSSNFCSIPHYSYDDLIRISDAYLENKDNKDY